MSGKARAHRSTTPQAAVAPPAQVPSTSNAARASAVEPAGPDQTSVLDAAANELGGEVGSDLGSASADGDPVMGLASVWAQLIPAMELLVSDFVGQANDFSLSVSGGDGIDSWSQFQSESQKLSNMVCQFEQERWDEMGALNECGENIGVLNKILAQLPDMLLTGLYAGRVDRAVNPSSVAGPSGVEGLGHLPFQAPPSMGANAETTIWAWHVFLVDGFARWLEAYKAAPEVIRFAQSLGPYAGMASVAEGFVAPMREHDGFVRAYLDALFMVNVSDPGWRALCQDHGHSADQARLQAAGLGDSIDDLDAGVAEILDELNDFMIDEDRITEILESARTDEERIYLLSRLMQTETEEGRAYDQMEGEIGGEKRFEAVRANAGHFAQNTVGGGVDQLEYFGAGQMMKMIPGAVVGTGMGMLASTPLLGDILEKEYGEDAKNFVDGIHADCGVDGDLRRLSTEIAIGGGKAAGALGGMAIGGGTTNGIKAWSAASKGQRALTAAGGIYMAADIGNSGYKAYMGETITGDAISNPERFAEAVGAIGGIADVVKAVHASRTALEVVNGLAKGNAQIKAGIETEAQAQAQLCKSLGLAPDADVSKIRTALGAILAKENNLEYAAVGAKVYAAYVKDPQADVDAMPDADVRAAARAAQAQQAQLGGKTTGRESALEQAIKADDLAGMRRALVHLKQSGNAGGKAENVILGTATAISKAAR